MPPNTTTQSEPLRQIVEKLGEANNVLVTVNANPTVDQLAACIGLTLALNKQGKHATAVYSGKTPSTLEFLQPDRTIEKNTDSLRDFIISLDKAKADKLRYKVEDDFVKIFITPYRTSIDEKDLAFSQGDFNIDLIITLGVHERAQLDATIVAHGRILHDAPVVSINTDTISDLGTINWIDNTSSSLCEMATDLVMELSRDLFDAQIATALLTGMVAETDRFGNEKAHPHTMSVSGVLMAAGASPQLIAAKLVEPEPESESKPKLEETALDIRDSEDTEDSKEEPAKEAPAKTNDGIMEIDHTDDDNIHIDEQGRLKAIEELEKEKAEIAAQTELPAPVEESAELPPLEPVEPTQETEPTDSRLVLDPPQLGGQLTANSVPEYEQYSPSTDPLSPATGQSPLLERADDAQLDAVATEGQTLADLERSVDSPHLKSEEELLAAVESARVAGDDYRPEPINALGATPLDLNLGRDPAADSKPAESSQTPPPVPPPMPPSMMPPNAS